MREDKTRNIKGELKMNKVIVIGNLARDNELKEGNGTKYVFNSIAVNKPSKDDKKESMFIPFTAFNKTAELLEKYTGKGSKIAIEGHINISTKETDGKKTSTMSLIADSIEFCSSAKKKEKSELESIPDTLDDDLPFV